MELRNKGLEKGLIMLVDVVFFFKSIVIWEGLGNPAHSYQPPALLRRLCLPPEADEVL